MANYKTTDIRLAERLQKAGFQVIGMSGRPKEYEFTAEERLIDEFLAKPEEIPAAEIELEQKSSFPFFKKRGRPNKKEVK